MRIDGSAKKYTYIISNGSRKSTINVKGNIYSLELNRSPSDEILIANNEKQVYIYDPTGSTLKHTVPTKHNTYEAGICHQVRFDRHEFM